LDIHHVGVISCLLAVYVKVYLVHKQLLIHGLLLLLRLSRLLSGVCGYWLGVPNLLFVHLIEVVLKGNSVLLLLVAPLVESVR
jgi:hypothetical protein